MNPRTLDKFEAFLEQEAEKNESFVDFFMERLDSSFFVTDRRHTFQDIGFSGVGKPGDL